MAALIIISIIGAAAGVVLGAYLRICFAIRREDRTKGSLRLNAPDQSARSARNLVGISSSMELRRAASGLPAVSRGPTGSPGPSRGGDG